MKQTLCEEIFGEGFKYKNPLAKDVFEVTAIYLLERFDPKLAFVISARFGFMDGERKIFKEIGEMLGIRGDRAGQLSRRALRLIRHPIRARHLVTQLIGPNGETAQLCWLQERWGGRKAGYRWVQPGGTEDGFINGT